MLLPMGQYDAPQDQADDIFYLDPYKKNIAVFGSSMSGKTTFIKTLLVQMHRRDPAAVPPELIYIIDFGGNIGKYAGLGHVAACFDNSNEENIKRIFKIVEGRLAENAKQLGSESYYSVLRQSKDPATMPPHITFIIENVNAFLADERYASYLDRFVHFCRDGLSKGLSVIITAGSTSGIGRMLTYFDQKIAFEMPSESYPEIFGSKVGQPIRLPGRGVATIDAVAYEFQAFLPFAEADDSVPLQALMRTVPVTPERILPFPEVMTPQDPLFRSRTSQVPPDEITIGLDYYEQQPVTVNVAESRAIAIYGKRQFGKTNLLKVLLDGLERQYVGAQYIFLDDGRCQLTRFRRPNDLAHYHYFDNVADCHTYLTDSGYIPQVLSDAQRAPSRIPAVPVTPPAAPITVFVVQSKTLFRSRTTPRVKPLMTWLLSAIAEADTSGYLFIFPDVPNMSDPDTQTLFNDSISLAFLLDDIGEFVAERAGKSVFSEMNPKELKAEYAKCSRGDGYIYNIDADILQKLKIIKVL